MKWLVSKLIPWVRTYTKKKKKKELLWSMYRDASMYGADTIRSITHAIPQVGVRQK